MTPTIIASQFHSLNPQLRIKATHFLCLFFLFIILTFKRNCCHYFTITTSVFVNF